MSVSNEGLSRFREIQVGQPQTQIFPSNYVSTTKYSPLTFIPLNLFEQFRRLSNFYFLLIAILQLIPGFSTLDPITSILPLIFVVLVTMVKEAAEDLRRHSSDKKANSKLTLQWNGKAFQKIPWKDIQVGDYIRIDSDEMVPADIAIFYSPLEDGICNIETTNLDGETNLKTKQAVHFDAKYDDFFEDLDVLRGKLVCDKPNPYLYHFTGRFEIPGVENVPINNTNIILRSCCLRNTPYIIGLVVYTGPDSKIMMNSGASPRKHTNLESLLNIFVFIAFVIQMAICLFCAGMHALFAQQQSSHTYLRLPSPAQIPLQSAKEFVAHLILFSALIPISLYVTLEVARLVQVLFINQDRAMYDSETDTRANARTSNLNEALGSIEALFTDKTGTLTQNVMSFFKCSVAGRAFGQGISQIKLAEMKR